MKLIQYILSGLLLFTQTYSYSQLIKPDASLYYYNRGLKMFEVGNFKQADSVFSYSAKLKPHRDTYYNLALTKFHLGDTCAFCDNLKNAEKYGDYEAGVLFDSKCIVKRKINFDNSAHPDSIYYAFFAKSNCTHNIVEREYFIKDIKSGQVSTFVENTADSSENNLLKMPGAFPELNKFSNEPFDTIVFTVVEIMPSFPGGDDARIRFLENNIIYPQYAKEHGILGTVYVTFVVNKDGSVSDVYILRGIGGGCDEEAVRVVKQMPKWNPGYQSGKPVRVQFNMPVRFT
jgi:TonB family protein